MIETNRITEQYGLSLSKRDAELILAERSRALRESKRVGFGEGIMPKIIYEFCDSEFIDQNNYVDMLVRLQEIFYSYKNEMQARFDSYGNHCLYDTFGKEMPEFFKWYDIRFAPQDTILTLDYPVLKDLTAYTGIDRIYKYLVCIRQEQDFLSAYPREYIIDILRGYNPSYEDMIENIYEIVSEFVCKNP